MSERIQAGLFEAGGIAFTVETNRPGFAARVGNVFRDLAVTDGGSSPVVFEVLHGGAAPPANPWGVWCDGEPRAMTVADSYVLVYLLWEIGRLLFDRTGDRLHLHGAALVRNGRAVVLAGRSHAGKSTLAGWLTHRGWGFLTDEAALVDPATLIVSPFWRPINVRRPGPLDSILGEAPPARPEDSELLVPASTIGALAPAAPVAGIAFPSFAPNEPAALSPVSPAAALVELTQHFPGLIADGRAGFRRLARLVEAVPAYILSFHDLDDAEQALRTLVGTTS
jgi:hypothetical protein